MLLKNPDLLLLTLTTVFFVIGLAMELAFRKESKRFKLIARLMITIFLATTPLYVSSPLLKYHGYDYHRYLFATFAIYAWICWVVGCCSARICSWLVKKLTRLTVDRKVNVEDNALTDEYQDLVEVGVIDPAKVTRSALQNAASVASMMLAGDAVIADMPKEDKAPAEGMR